MDISAEAHSRSPPPHVSLLKACQPGPYSLASDPRLDTRYVVGADGVLRSFEMSLHRPDVIDAVPLSPAQIRAHIEYLTSQSIKASDAENRRLGEARVRLEKLFDGVDGTRTAGPESFVHGRNGSDESEDFQRDISMLNQECRRLQQSISARSEPPPEESSSYNGPGQMGMTERSWRGRSNSYYSMEGR